MTESPSNLPCPGQPRTTTGHGTRWGRLRLSRTLIRPCPPYIYRGQGQGRGTRPERKPGQADRSGQVRRVAARARPRQRGERGAILDVVSRATLVIATRIPEDVREEFLNHVRQGASRYDAALAVDPTRERTATVWRRLAVEDADFRAAYERACSEREALSEEIRADYRDELRTVLRARATNLEEKSSRFLLAEAATHLPEYEWMRNRGRREPEPATEFQIPQVDPALLSTDELEELHAVAQRFWELVEIGQGRRPSGRAIEGEATAA